MKTSRRKTIGAAHRVGIAACILATLAAPLFAGFSGTDLFLASVGRGPGASSSQWYTTAWIENPSSSTATVQVMFLERKHPNPSPVTVTISVPAGDTVRYANILADLFSFDNKFGALRFVSDQKIVVACRIFNLPADGTDRDTQGQDYAGIPASFGISKGQSTQLLGVYQTSTDKSVSPFRYSFGLAECAGGTANVHVKALDGTGAVVAEKDYGPLGPYEVEYYPIEDLSPSISSQNLRLEVSVTDGTGKVISVGSGVANQSNDGTTFEMQFADSLLGGGGPGGLTFVSHDVALVGDGTPSNPLGIANGGVTDAKVASGISYAKLSGAPTSLPPSGPAGGDLTGTYPNPTLKLPYDGTTSSAGDVFSVTNNGVGGTAVHAYAGGGAGVSASGLTGVHGGGTSGNGVEGSSTSGNGVEGSSSGSFGKAGVVAVGTSTNSTGIAAYANSPAHQAGWFVGDVQITGNFAASGGTKAFRIDHPLDPENKELWHAAIESSEVLNQYSGNVVTDANGEATVILPDWFEAANTDYRYQLTVIGGGDVWAQTRVTREIENNSFRIQTSVPQTKVSWQVIARRNDAWMKAHPFVVERDKPERERGSYLTPEAFNQPEEKGVDWARNPDMMRKMKAERERVAATGK